MSIVPPEDIILDTDGLSFFFNRDAARVPRYAPHLRGRLLYTSFASAAEMRFGALLRGWGPARRRQLDRFLDRYTVVDSTLEIGRTWAQIRVDCQRLGRPIERQDAWVAAVAIHLDLPLATHNARHFEHVPLLRLITEPDP